MAKNISEAIKAAFKKTLPLNEEENANTNTRKRKASEPIEQLDNNNEDSLLTSPQASSSSTNTNNDGDQNGSISPTAGSSRHVKKISRLQAPSMLEKNSGKDLFLEKTPIYENEHIKIFVVKDYLKRQKIFKLDDHLYSLKIEIKDGHPPLLSSLLDVLRQAFEFMIKSLKNFYPEDERNIMYMTIYQNSMQSALNSGGFELHGNQPQNMVNYALNMLNRFLNSNATIKLDDSFCVYFKVLSVQHVNYAFHRRGPLMVVGCSDGNQNTPGTIELDVSLEENVEFVNKCLLTHIILGKLQSEAKASQNYGELALLLSLCKKRKNSYEKHYFTKKRRSSQSETSVKASRKKGLKLLKSKVDELIFACDLNVTGPYNVHEVVPKICEFYNVQVHVICGLQTKNASLLSFPPQFDDTKTQIILEKTSQEHVNLISNLKTFFRYHKKRLCFECCKTFHQTYRHFCTKRNVCFACRRFFCTSQTNLQNDKYFEFCDSQIEENCLPEPSVCKLCNMVLLTKSCEQGHKNQCGIVKTSKGRMGFYCNLCQKHFKHGFRNSQDAKNNHVCSVGIPRCYNCKFLKEENHQCPIKKEEATKEIPNLAFFAFSFKSLEQCNNCLNVRKLFKAENNLTWQELYQHEKFATLVCETHDNLPNCSVEPNVAVIYKETARGVFDKFLVAEDALQISEDQSEQILFQYLPSNIVVKDFRICTNYEKKAAGMLRKLEILKTKPKKTLMENFLLLIAQPEWQNTTFLSLNANNCNNLAVLKAFIEIDVMPYVIENGNKVNLISVDFLNLRFLNASAYLAGSIQEIRDQFNVQEDVYYFPLS